MMKEHNYSSDWSHIPCNPVIINHATTNDGYKQGSFDFDIDMSWSLDSIFICPPQPHVASSIPRMKEQQRWTYEDPRHPWHRGYGYQPFLRLQCVVQWRWSGWPGRKERRRRQRPQGQRWRQACTAEDKMTQKKAKVRNIILTAEQKMQKPTLMQLQYVEHWLRWSRQNQC